MESVIHEPSEAQVVEIFNDATIGTGGLGHFALHSTLYENDQPRLFEGEHLQCYRHPENRIVVSRAIDSFLFSDSWLDELIDLPGDGSGSDYRIESRFFVPTEIAVWVAQEFMRRGNLSAIPNWDDPHL